MKTSAARRALGQRRRDAVRHLMHRDQMIESVHLAPQVSWRNAILIGFQAALSVLIALPLFYFSPWSHLIGFGALGALVGLFGRFEPAGRRMPMLMQTALTQVGGIGLMSLAAALGASMGQQLVLMVLACGGVYIVWARGRFGAPGPLIFIFAVGASVKVDLSLFEVIERLCAVSAVAALTLLICAATERFRQLPTVAKPLPKVVAPPWRSVWIIAARCAAAAGLAVLVSQWMGGKHPAWAAMGAMAVIMVPRLNLVMNRALQRMAGTVVGSLLAWVVLSLEPSVLVVIAVLALLQLATEMIVGLNYGLGLAMVTPMALLMTWLGAGRTLGAEIAPERVLETLVGAVVALILAVVFSTLHEREHLAGLRRGG